MRRKYKAESVNTPEDLRQFEGWEIRKFHVGRSSGIILQNPDTGEKCKLVLAEGCFDGNRLKISRKSM